MTTPAPVLDHASPHVARCRFCDAPITFTMVDLGKSPLCETMLDRKQLNDMEPFYPLHVYVCGECFLVQLEEYVSPDKIFTDYIYFSSYSDSWLDHAKRFVQDMTRRFSLDETSQVVELASNDGYLLQYFVETGIPSLGIEPAVNVAEAAKTRGVETITEFFGAALGRELAEKDVLADLLIGNNVLAQVPDLNDFVAGMKALLAPQGIFTMEFPHLFALIDGRQFDTIYHEHFSYFSFTAATRIFEAQDLILWDVEELPTHGGSLRIFGCHRQNRQHPRTERAEEMLTRERERGVDNLSTYAAFGQDVENAKCDLLSFLIDAKRRGETVVGYGAPGKGNTLLNYCGIRTDLLAYTVDRNPVKQGHFLPGTHIPVHKPETIFETKPDYVLILPWNLRNEIIAQMSAIKEWGGRFVVPIPALEVIGPEPS